LYTCNLSRDSLSRAIYEDTAL